MKRIVRARGESIEYMLVCVRNRTSYLLQALPQGKIRLYAPAGCSLREADGIVKQNLDKIRLAHANMAKASRALPGHVLLEGKMRKIEIVPSGAGRITVLEDTLRVMTPYETEEDINAQIKRYLVKLALERIRMALDRYSPTVNVPYGRVTIREQRTRWGSCSDRHNLNFNWKLIMAPPQALEYVVVHELCHLIYLNHSARFWEEVHLRMPDYEIWKKWLADHGRELVFP